MANILPFQRTGMLISEIDGFLDKVSEGSMVFEQTVLHYVDKGADDELEEKLQQIVAIETRGDELRGNVIRVMYTQMLMPDTRGDVLGLLDELDNVLDDFTHSVVKLVIERPEMPEDTHDGFKTIAQEVTKAAQAMVQGARAYFKEPHAVRDSTHKINFHNTEATKTALRLGRQIFDSELPLARKLQLRDWLLGFRRIASNADDVGDRIGIYAVKRSI